MICEAEGKILEELARRTGQAHDGKEMESIEFLLEEDKDRYHYRMRFTMTSFDGPVVDAPCVGDRVKVWFTVQAREWQGKWYNNVYAYRVEAVKG